MEVQARSNLKRQVSSLWSTKPSNSATAVGGALVASSICTTRTAHTRCIVCGRWYRLHFKRGGMSVFCRRRPGHGSAPAKVSAYSSVSMVRGVSRDGLPSGCMCAQKASLLSRGLGTLQADLDAPVNPSSPLFAARAPPVTAAGAIQSTLRHTRRKSSLAGSLEQLMNRAAVWGLVGGGCGSACVYSPQHINPLPCSCMHWR